MQTIAFDAELRWDPPPFVPEVGLKKRVVLETSGEGFGLLDCASDGWALCIPDGAQAEASVGETPVDLGRLRLEPSGERRLLLCAGLRAKVRMGEFSFELAPSA
jgi:hypothetical protein